MLRLHVFALMTCALLAACGGGGSEMLTRAQLSKPKQNQYPQIVAAFVNQCVKAPEAGQISVASNLYTIDQREGSCGLTADTYFDDDTVIADLLTKELKRADPRFTRLSNGLLGAAWSIGNITRWSASDGKPLISLGRSSAKSPLMIRRFGPSL